MYFLILILILFFVGEGILMISLTLHQRIQMLQKKIRILKLFKALKVQLVQKISIFDKRSNPKIPMERGATVNFVETSYPIIHDANNQNYTGFMWHGRSFRINRITPMISSDNTNINEGIDNL